jgi:hypothetical protein
LKRKQVIPLRLINEQSTAIKYFLNNKAMEDMKLNIRYALNAFLMVLGLMKSPI